MVPILSLLILNKVVPHPISWVNDKMGQISQAHFSLGPKACSNHQVQSPKDSKQFTYTMHKMWQKFVLKGLSHEMGMLLYIFRKLSLRPLIGHYKILTLLKGHFVTYKK